MSIAQDRVWAQVSGLRSFEAGRRLLMVFQAYIDESIDDETIVLAGYIASAEDWALFAREWEKLLPMGVMGPDGRYRFKMREMAATEERMQRVSAFYRVIESIKPLGITFHLKLSDLQNAIGRISLTHDYFTNIDFDKSAFNDYRIAFFGLLRLFHDFRDNDLMQEFLALDQKIDFIFDETSNKKSILEYWDEFMANNPNKDRFGATPRFENDDDFLPLQAADFLAWWIREWEASGADKSQKFPWETHVKLPIYHISSTEDDLTESFIQWMRARTPADINITDKADKF